ncbi:MAG: glycosyltransferase [Lachnospiraceae bacterium]|nr:glycosyltransferase [Lachnospiraceae bacterium]
MNKKKKVVQLITSMADGGAETLVKDYAMLEDRNQVDMIIVSWCEKLGSANERLLKEAGVRVVYLGEIYRDKAEKSIFYKVVRRVRKYTEFRKLIMEENVDVIHVHLRFGRYLKALPSDVLKKIKLFYTLHNEPGKYFDASGSGKKGFEYKEAKRLIDKYGLTVITLHKQMEDEVRRLFDTDNVITINNGINLERFDRSKYDSKSIQNELGIEEDTKVIGHVGSFTYQKNHEKLIGIFEEYLKEHENSVLLLVGKGVEKQQMIDLVKGKGLDEKVIFLENRSDVPELMSIMDVFVLPSRWEGFPVVLIEAQAMGLRCVISDKVTKDAILSDRVCVVGLEDESAGWIEAIEEHKEPEEPHGTLEEFDIRRSIEKLTELYS